MKNEQIYKHLEFIQNTIHRMNSNSFMVKGWCITIVAALFALSLKDNGGTYLPLISLIVVIPFWYLDGFFLATEKNFRKLYNQVRTQDDTDFNMTPSKITFKQIVLDGMLTQTIWPFYLLAIIVAVLIYLWLIYPCCLALC